MSLVDLGISAVIIRPALVKKSALRTCKLKFSKIIFLRYLTIWRLFMNPQNSIIPRSFNITYIHKLSLGQQQPFTQYQYFLVVVRNVSLAISQSLSDSHRLSVCLALLRINFVFLQPSISRGQPHELGHNHHESLYDAIIQLRSSALSSAMRYLQLIGLSKIVCYA